MSMTSSIMIGAMFFCALMCAVPCAVIFMFLCKSLGEDIVRISIKKRKTSAIIQIFGIVLCLLITGCMSFAPILVLQALPRGDGSYGIITVILLLFVLFVCASITAYLRGRDNAKKEVNKLRQAALMKKM